VDVSEPAADPFEALVQAALAEIPAEFRRYLDNVAIVIEDEPPAPWLGVYQGYTTRNRDLPGKQPDVIRFFRGPMLRSYGHDPELLAREVRRLVRHEVAHHFGISDARLIELGRY
jgi:predicted Zn-dependent protease with MMP-like domain